MPSPFSVNKVLNVQSLLKMMEMVINFALVINMSEGFPVHCEVPCLWVQNAVIIYVKHV